MDEGEGVGGSGGIGEDGIRGLECTFEVAESGQ